MIDRQIQTDVLVIGGGLAGMRAASAAWEMGAATALVLKGRLGSSGSSAIAGGGLAAVLNNSPGSGDSIERHFLDTMAGGDFINDPALVRTMVGGARGAVEDLERVGAEFVREGGGAKLFLAPAHTCMRSIRCEGGGSARLMQPFASHIKSLPVTVIEDTTVFELLSCEGRVCGALAVTADDEIIAFSCRSVVVASGGAGRVYPLTSTTAESTGDGYGLALRQGLALTGMEFVQFTPTALAYPEELSGTSTGGVLIGFPETRFFNNSMDRFMLRYDPVRKEASTRAILSRAISKEVLEGRGTAHGGVYLDLTKIPAETLERIAGHFMKKLRPYGIDISRDMLEVAPAVHYFMGGIEINPLTETGLPGLFAAGEVCGGVQGSNRLSSNALTECNVFGGLAGKAAAAFASAQTFMSPDGEKGLAEKSLYAWVARSGEDQASALDIQQMRAQIQKIMIFSAGIVRDRDGLSTGLEEVREIRSRAERLPRAGVNELKARFELQNMVDTAEAVISSALYRTESRGAHYRSDYPERDDSRWLAATRARWNGQLMEVTRKPLPENLAFIEKCGI